MSELTERRWAHIRGVTVTAIACLFGVGAGVLSAAYASSAGDPLGLLIMGAAILGQFPLLRVIGIEVETFGAKDYLYVAFMTFCLWFVSWGILLTAGVTVSF